MPYITSERVKEIRNTLKKQFPQVKFSVTRNHYSVVQANIMVSPFKWESEYEQLNPFYLDRYDHADFLQSVYDIMNEGNGVLVEDGDYGTVPNFYVHIQIGKWDKPHVTVQ